MEDFVRFEAFLHFVIEQVCGTRKRALQGGRICCYLMAG
jgi:hypothetical protein